MVNQVNTTNQETMQILQQMTSTMGQIGKSAGGSYEEIAWMVQAINSSGTVAMGDHNQRAAGIENISQLLSKLFLKIAGNEASNAAKEVNEELTDAQKAALKAKEQEKKIKNNITETEKQINNQSAIVKNSTETLEAKQKELEEKENAVQEILKQIAEQQNALTNETDSTKQADILNKIQGLSGQLSEQISAITTIKESVAQLSTLVENAYSEIETAQENQVQVQEEGQEIIQGLQNDILNTTSEVVQTSTEAGVNEATAATASSAAATASTNLFTASQAPKLLKIASDQGAAAATRATGAVSNLRELQDGIGRIKNNKSLLESFNTTIGGAIDNFSSLTGAWNGVIEPFITSIGSYDGLAEIKEELDTAVKNDLGKISGNTNTSSEDNGINDNNESENIFYTKQNGIRPDLLTNDFETPKVKLELNIK